MKKVFSIIQTSLLAGGLLFSSPLWAANVIGYFTSWGMYGEDPYTPDDIPYDKLTHIQYAFFLPDTLGTIVSSDPWADELNLEGANSLVALAHEHGVKVLPSVGGWTGSSEFPALAGSAQRRSRFCSSARALIQQYDFDGIDIDWEYPGYVPHNGTPDDAQNFVLLLSELRDTLDAMGDGHKLITLAIAGSSYHGDRYLLEQCIDDVDFVSIMTYDYTGAGFSQTAWHNSPLYDYHSDEHWSVDRAMSYYAERGIPASKLNIGMAFYGRSFAGCEGVGSPHAGAGTGQPGEPGMIHYATVADLIAGGTYTPHWDSLAGVPYCTSADGEYCSYDDTTSIRMKAQYCVQKGFGGAIIWELKAGRAPDGSQPLLDAAAGVLMQPSAVARRDSRKPGVARVSRMGETITFTLQSPSRVSTALYDMQGRAVLTLGTNHYDRGEHALELGATMENLSTGNYLVELRSQRWTKRLMMPKTIRQ
ncbi:MAG: glycoside hydrolase family 18 protein [Chitinivibrionales bacterium]